MYFVKDYRISFIDSFSVKYKLCCFSYFLYYAIRVIPFTRLLSLVPS